MIITFQSTVFSTNFSSGAEEIVRINCGLQASRVQLFLCGRLRDHEIVSITARVRNNGSLYWNLAAICIIGLSIKVRCLSG